MKNSGVNNQQNLELIFIRFDNKLVNILPMTHQSKFEEQPEHASLDLLHFHQNIEFANNWNLDLILS